MSDNKSKKAIKINPKNIFNSNGVIADSFIGKNIVRESEMKKVTDKIQNEMKANNNRMQQELNDIFASLNIVFKGKTSKTRILINKIKNFWNK